MYIVGLDQVEPLTRREYVQEIVDDVVVKYPIILDILSSIGVAIIEDDRNGFCVAEDYVDCRIWLDKGFLIDETRFQVKWVIVHELYHVILNYMSVRGYEPSYDYDPVVVEKDLSAYANEDDREFFCEVGVAVYCGRTEKKPFVSDWIYAEHTKIMLLLADM